MARQPIAILVVVIVVCPLAAPRVARAGEPFYASQGWSAEQRLEVRQTPTGSQLIPREWFLALEQPFARAPFRDTGYLEGFGFLAENPTTTEPNPIPIGLVTEPGPENVPFIGLNCAACHTTQIEHGGKKLRIDGGAGLLDYQSFIEAVSDALIATLRDANKMDRFAVKVLGQKDTPAARNALHEAVRSRSEWLAGFVARNRPAHRAGFGRLDALGVLANESLGTALGVTDNYRVPAAPARSPRLWLTPRLDWLQWNGGVQNPGVRNLAEGLGVFGRIEARTVPGGVSFHSTADLRGMQKIWERLDELKPPAWPEDVLGKIDQELAATGAKIYSREKCATCHADKAPYPLTPTNTQGKQFIRVTKSPLAEIGTDPLTAEQFVKRSARTGRMAGVFGGKETVPATDLFFAILGMTAMAKFEQLKLAPAELQKVNGNRDPGPLPTHEELLVYKATPLAGVWSTAPYLHNGSVPTLHDLLLRTAERPKRFHVGTRAFDPKRVGFESGERPGTFEFDTTLPGNSNAGHEYGTKLSDADRRALIEYLKTL
jgi:mono/diheme cytochrome c family protein